MADATRSLKLIVEEEKKGNGFTQAADDLDKLGKGVTTNDEKMKRWAETQKSLQVEIDKSKTRIKELHQEVAKTGDTSLFGDIRKEEAKLRGFTKTLEALAPEGAKAGNSFMSSFAGALDGTPIKSVLIASLVAAAIVAAPAIGAAVSGAVTGLVGVGGIAGGIAAASKDPVVRSAAAELGDYISQQFFSGGAAFVEPIRQATAILKADVAKLDLGHLFDPAAGSVTLLATGIGAFVTKFEPGLERALQKLGPFMSAVADGLAEDGAALGQFVDDISRNHGAVEGLRFLFGAVDVTVRILGKSLEFLAATFHVADVAFLKMVDTADAVATALHLPHENLDKLKHDLEANINSGTRAIPVVAGLGDAFAGSAAKGEDLAKAFKDASDAEDQWINKNLAAADATLAVNQGWIDLNENLHKGKKNWDITTQAGIDNTKMLDAQIQKLEAQRQAAIANGDGTAASIRVADRAYDEALQKLLDIAKQAGDTQAALDQLARTYTITVREQVLVSNQITKANAIDRALEMHNGRASGGPVMANMGYIVGENGPEYFVPKQSGTIIPNGASSTAGATQMAPVDVRVSLDPALAGHSGDLAAALLTLLRFEIRGQGGNVQNVLGR